MSFLGQLINTIGEGANLVWGAVECGLPVGD